MKTRNPLDIFAMPKGHAVQRDLTKMIDRAVNNQKSQWPDSKPFWNETFFGLDKTSLFKSLSKEKQTLVLAKLSESLIAEAWSIEKCGMTFGAKMSLLSNSHEESILYSLLAADEAKHFHMISHFFGDQ